MKSIAWKWNTWTISAIAILGLAFVGSFVEDEPALVVDAVVAQAPSAVDLEAERDAETVAALQPRIEALLASGAVSRVNRDGGDVYLDESAWAMLHVDDKERVITLFSRYREAKTNLPQVTIYGDHSGRELAGFGVFNGVYYK